MEPYLVDIAVNLTDTVFRGVSHSGQRLHEDDFDLVLQRAADAGVHKMIVTGTSLEQSERAVQLCRQYPGRLLCTVGVHPAHSSEFLKPVNTPASVVTAAGAVATSGDAETNASQRLERLVRLANENRDVVVAVGEIGIDFAELSLSSREVQERFFVRQLHAFSSLDLPFLFHSRDCGSYFVDVLKRELPLVKSPHPVSGVVHSFNGSAEEQKVLLDMGLYLSLNGSAFRTEQLAMQVCDIPLDRLLLETDAPWCDIRPKDYCFPFVSTVFETNKKKKPFVMGKCYERRNEPCHLVQVVEAFLGCLKKKRNEIVSREQMTQILYANYLKAFRLPH